jgi:hypothetical protein
MRADAGFDGDALNRFDTERAQDILYLTGMCFPFPSNRISPNSSMRHTAVSATPVSRPTQYF